MPVTYPDYSMRPRTLAQSGLAVAHTGDTNETILATVPIPAGSMGPNGSLRIWSLWSHPNNANTKNLRIRLGGIGGTAFCSLAVTTTATTRLVHIVSNVNAQNVQTAFPANTSAVFGSSTGSLTTGAIDTSAAQDLVFTTLLGVGTDTVTLRWYQVELSAG